nr:two-component system sensor histidine kinase CreC [Verrucomicrobiota bacterium]
MRATTRILLGFLLFLAVGLYFLATRLTKRVERQYLEAAEEPMVDTAQIFAALLEQHLDETGVLDLTTIRTTFAAAHAREFAARIYNFTKTSINTNVYVTDRHGVVLFDSDEGRAEGQDYRAQRDVRLTLAGHYGARSTRADDRDNNSSVMFVGAPIRQRGEIVGVVSVSKPQASMFAFMGGTRKWIRRLTLAFFLAVSIGAVLVTTLFSRPIRRLTEYARAISRGERAPPPRFDAPEVRTLAHAFEEMRDALENRKYVETYVQTLTHEMKSPVAAIRGAAELLHEEMPPERRARFHANIQAESRRLQNIIDRLLALSAIESRKALERPAPVAFADLAASVCAQLEAAAEARGVRFEIIKHAGLKVLGEPFLLEIALTNLMQNAIEFSAPGSVVKLEIGPGAERNTAELSVVNSGPSIPEYALPRIFERFYSLQRPATGRKSSGLGLCFVREAA